MNIDPRVKEITRQYSKPSDKSAMVWFIVPFFLYHFNIVIFDVLAKKEYWYFLPFLLMVNVACLLRLVSIQHDCGHYSFLTNVKFNSHLGNLISIFTLVPHKIWIRAHNHHHLNIGKLNTKGLHEVRVMRLSDFQKAPPLKKLMYYLYRHPLFLFVVAPFLLFFILYRIPKNTRKSDTAFLLFHNTGVILYFICWYYLGGINLLLFIVLSLFFAGVIGIAVFYIQHNFEDTYLKDPSEWNRIEAIFQGSSVINFGKFFNVISGNVAFHDLHHLSPKIPSYRLEECYNEIEPLLNSKKIGFQEFFKSLSLALWDENENRMVTFKEARKL